MRSVVIDKSRDKVNDECGVFGFYNNDDFDIVSLTQDGLYGLQHRGQESAGITVIKDGEPFTVKDIGIVSTVFTEKNLKKLKTQAKEEKGKVI